jgi:hypothetical protein
LLLSNLCDEVGLGLYEMRQEVRSNLLNCLEHNNRFGIKRIKEIAVFLGVYVKPQLKSDILNVRDLAQSQNWVSLAYLCPERAAKELATKLAEEFNQKSANLCRIASIVGALERPLEDYPGLIVYAQGMAKYAQDDIVSAQKMFIQLRNSQDLSSLLPKGVPFPQDLQYQIITGFPWPAFAHKTNKLGSQSINIFLVTLLIFLMFLIFF